MAGEQPGSLSGPDPGPEASADAETIALVVEPAGEYADDEIMVAGLHVAGGWRLFTQEFGESAASLEAMIGDRIAEHGSVSVHASERALLQAVTEFVVGQVDVDTDSGRGAAGDANCVVLGYDEPYLHTGLLPLLRTRVASHALPWPFWDCSYLELRSVIEEQFNTRTPDGSTLGLPAAFKLLTDDVRGAGLNVVDPVASAAAAREAAARLQAEDLIVHSVVDVYRVSILGRTLQRYCSLADLQPTEISPAKQATLEYQS